jgi:hypothetical protein
LDSSVFEQTEFLLRTSITGTRGHTQQVVTDTAVPGVAAFPAHQLTETALRRDHAFACRLFEQVPRQVLGIAAVTQTRTVEQPFGHTHGKSLGRGNTKVFGGNRV